jgi:hypothetical protein
MEELLTMTTRELDKLRVIRQVLERTLRWREAAAQLGVCVRQIARLCVRVRAEGTRGIVHRLRGRASNHQWSAGLLDQAVRLVQRQSPDFGPTFANEQRRERHHLTLSTWTLRRGMIAEGLWRPRHRPERHRAWANGSSAMGPTTPGSRRGGRAACCGSTSTMQRAGSSRGRSSPSRRP